jgi:DNA processing protein
MSEVISDKARAHLRWALIDGVGPLGFTRLISYFGNAEKALTASAMQLAQVPRFGGRMAEAIVRARDQVALDEEIQAAAAQGVRIVCRDDPQYPPGLRQIPDAPIVLYIKGEYRQTDTLALAVVGSRRCTIYGSEQARRFGELLAGAGFTVISGLARGIDSFAHHGAIEAGGRAIAVLGSGLTSIYPPENQALAQKVLENGAWFSELPMQASVRRENFPSRNRIIAGMSLGTLVVEAAARSGALITARLASDYNREVFAVPGRLQEPMAEGVNALIRDGVAKLVTSLDDILDGLGEVGYQLRLKLYGPAREGAREGEGEAPGGEGEAPAREGEAPAEPVALATRGRRADKGAPLFDAAGPADSGNAASHPSGPPTLSPAEKRVYDVIPYDAILQDMVIRAAELPPGEVLAALTTLELKGLIKRMPGNLVLRRGRA